MQQLIYSIILSFVVGLLLTPLIIPLLRRLKFGQMVRDDGPKTHLSKAGTPTMGGIAIVLTIVIVSLLMSGGAMEYIVFALLVTVGYALVGFLDDFIKILKKRSKGLNVIQKVIGQLGLAIVVALFAYNDPGIGSKVIVPFIGVEWDMGIWYIPFTAFVMVAIVNSVNLTDGLDGLASGVTFIYSAAFGIICIAYITLAGNAGQTLLEANLKDMLVFTGSITGGTLAFLRFNTYPAKVFMGDTGSLALGAAVGLIAIVLKLTLLIPIMGLMFVLSAVSVVLQVGSYKLRGGKRVFRMAPLHHHFELAGVPETKIVAMYMIATVLLCLIGLLGAL